jgi:hypothetical protein
MCLQGHLVSGDQAAPDRQCHNLTAQVYTVSEAS